MKTVFLTSSLGSGGAERVATTLCNAWVARGDEVVLIPTFSGGGRPFYPLDARVSLRYLADEVGGGCGGKRHLRRLWALRRMILAAQPDVVVAFLPNVNIAALAATAFTGIPCVIGERSDPVEQPIGHFWTTACRLFYRCADAVTVQTESVAQRIGTVYSGLKRIRVLPNPLPPELASLQPRAPDSGPANGRHVLLSVGRLSAEKRTDLIVAAFARVADHHPAWDLHVVGDGPLRDALQQQIERCGLPAGRVSLLGRSHSPWQLMREADAFVLASAYEGFPNALLEAVAIGLPSISTDCRSGPREISDEGRVVRLVPTDDLAALAGALDKLLGDPSLRRRLSETGPGSVRRRFSLPTVLARWDELFAAVTGSKRQQPPVPPHMRDSEADQ